MEKWNSLTATKKGLFVGLVVVVLLGIVFYFSDIRCGMKGNYFTCGKVSAPAKEDLENPLNTNKDTEVKEPLSESSSRPEPIVSEGNAVVANDQPAGPIVEVTMLTLSQPGWVAVYEDNNGVPGNVLGAARFEEGIHLGEISLLRSTEPNKTYYLILHADVSEKEFDLKKNAILMNASGAPIRTTFKTLE